MATHPETILAKLRLRLHADKTLFERFFDIGGGRMLAAIVVQDGSRRRIGLMTDVPGAILHWGTAMNFEKEWLMPPEEMRGAGASCADNAAQTPFAPDDGLWALTLEFAEAPLGIQFVLLQRGAKDSWIHFSGGNFYVPVRLEAPAIRPAVAGTGIRSDIAAEIVRSETERNSWTLMHRFNLCHDMLDRVRSDPDGLALLYVWLRFSAVRQLTWQRNYNTKPRELAHAQDRLTQKLAWLFQSEASSRPWIRLMLGCVGRGGDGQRIRDEILNIMHRHHIKEVTGHFLEEWHQKLHNNTTPDDIVICEAYLEFLRSNGNRDRFYQVLQEGGVTRQRLASFERPIRSDPDFVGWLKDGLTHDFQNFLRILKASHSGADLETSIQAARGRLDESTQGLLQHLWNQRNAPVESLIPLAAGIADARRRLAGCMARADGLREMLYLDLSLEQLLRAAVERNIHLLQQGGQLAELVRHVLDNLVISTNEPELAICLRHWDRLLSMQRFSAEWSLHAKSVADRIGRALTGWIDRLYGMLQPKAEYLGAGFKAESFSITLFSEEVVRGCSVTFVLSALLRRLDPVLRQTAQLGHWQIISRGAGEGKVEVAGTLHSIQRTRFDTPTVIIAEKVDGDEDIPEGVVAVLAPDVTDIVSHVAVRARNAGVLFAACYDGDALGRLKTMRGRRLRLNVSPGGDVLFQECAESAPEGRRIASQPHPVLKERPFSKYAAGLDEIGSGIVGGKSHQQAWLRGRLPDWIQLPASMAIPFGVFERVLELNKSVANQYAKLAARPTLDGDALRLLRETVMLLEASGEMKVAVQEEMSRAKLPPADWEILWRRIKQVWASKWNERAFLSRERSGIPHENLHMAVLIQEAIRADYAFVLHTVNPATGCSNELFGEMVLGLGETLVGNHPGRALGFVVDKTTLSVRMTSYPGKSTALHGGGLIVRSDSNGEDLPGFAGAGLYDSFLLHEPESVALDYDREPLVWDEAFRRSLLRSIGQIGLEVEAACGTPQDIEGVVAGGRHYVVQTRPQVGLD